MKVVKETVDSIRKSETNFWISIIIPLIGVAVGWGVMSNRLETLENRFDYFGGRFQTRQDLVDAKLESINSDYSKIQVTLAEIQRDILFIKESLSDHTK